METVRLEEGEGLASEVVTVCQFKIGDDVRTPESLPVSHGRVTRVYEGGRFFEVEKVYGRQRYRRKYTLATLLAAIEADRQRVKARRQRAKKAR